MTFKEWYSTTTGFRTPGTGAIPSQIYRLRAPGHPSRVSRERPVPRGGRGLAYRVVSSDAVFAGPLETESSSANKSHDLDIPPSPLSIHTTLSPRFLRRSTAAAVVKGVFHFQGMGRARGRQWALLYRLCLTNAVP
jgi:hypothetical protein